MKTTRDQCPACGAFSTASYSDGSYECLNCRNVTYDPYSPATSAFEASSWVHDIRPKRSRSNKPDDPPKPSRRSTRIAEEPATVPPALTALTLRQFVTLAGISEVVTVLKEQYRNGGTALQLWDEEGPLITATSWIPGIPEGHVAIKDYAENEGCLAELLRHGVVDPPCGYLGGFPICRLRF